MAEARTSDILLESGTNELEILIFNIAGNSYGINVAKVKDLMRYDAALVQVMPRSHENIEGVFKPRDEILTIINLAGYLGLPDSGNTERDIFIITSFNQMNLAFHVHSVESIVRFSWEDIEKPDVTIYGGSEGIVTGIAKIKDRIISIVDFEKIIFDISPESGIKVSEIDTLGERDRVSKPILLAEDSAVLRKLILESLHKAGYTNIIVTSNGQEAWTKLQEIRDTPGSLEKYISCIITDIEMPQMDGHRLTKNIKSDSKLRKIPVIIFSSLIDEKMRLKGEEVGADAQLSKPEISMLVENIDKLIL